MQKFITSTVPRIPYATKKTKLDKSFHSRPETAVPMALITDGKCRWGVADGESPALFCGARCEKTQNYCDEHHPIAYDTGKKRA